MKCSIAIATKDKAPALNAVLESIRTQSPSFDYEIIVVDDGSTDDTEAVCRRWDVDRYIRLENSIRRNPAVARNAAYKAAQGEIVIAQSDEVIHHTPDAIEQLVAHLQPGSFVIGTVFNYCVKTRKQLTQYTGLGNKRPLFFLGSLYLQDIYKVGGNDEDFAEQGYEDDWFARCLINGLGLKAKFVPTIVGYHQDHPRDPSENHRNSRALYAWKVAAAESGEGKFRAAAGSWQIRIDENPAPT